VSILKLLFSCCAMTDGCVYPERSVTLADLYFPNSCIVELALVLQEGRKKQKTNPTQMKHMVPGCIVKSSKIYSFLLFEDR